SRRRIGGRWRWADHHGPAGVRFPPRVRKLLSFPATPPLTFTTYLRSATFSEIALRCYNQTRSIRLQRRTRSARHSRHLSVKRTLPAAVDETWPGSSGGRAQP